MQFLAETFKNRDPLWQRADAWIKVDGTLALDPSGSATYFVRASWKREELNLDAILSYLIGYVYTSVGNKKTEKNRKHIVDLLNKQTRDYTSSIQRTDVTFYCRIFRNSISQPGVWRFSFCLSLILILPLFSPFVLSLFLSFSLVERLLPGGVEDEVRAAPPRRINRDRETRPLSHPPRSSSLLSSLFSLIRW